MIPIRAIETLIAFLGSVLFIGTLEATLTTFDPSSVGATSEGNLRIQLTTGFIYASIFALILLKMERFIPFIGRHILLVLFLLIPLLSVAWSVSPDATIRRSVALFGSSFFAIYLAFALPPERTLRIITTAYAITAVASLVTIFVLPVYGTHQFGEYAGLWRGVFATKNEFGATMAMGSVLLLICPKYTLYERILCRVFVVLCLILLIMSESRTAWVSILAVGAIVLPLRWISGRGLKTKLQTAVIVSITVLAVGGVVKYSEQILEFMGKDPTLTGRTGVWELAIDRALERPLLGYGYRAYWTPENKRRLRPTESWTDGIGHAHNTYIDLMVELGFLGIASFSFLLCMLVIAIFRRLAAHNDFINLWAVSCITFILVRGLAESTILQHADIHWIYFVYFSALIGAAKKTRLEQEPLFAGTASPNPFFRLSNVTKMKARDLVDGPYIQERSAYHAGDLRDDN